MNFMQHRKFNDYLFAGKICKAYAAKRQHENNKEQEAIAKAQRMKKIRWTFDAKARWELKGHM
ncbi:UNVERIFIED_CONTAM: hypothetical protein NCL1_16434 [Trichonephila clavipes]